MTVWLLFLVIGTAPVSVPGAGPYATFDQCDRAGSALRKTEVIPAATIPELRMQGYVCIPSEAPLLTR